jgi:hypothetical protein
VITYKYKHYHQPSINLVGKEETMAEKEGTTTKEKTGKRKWLGRIGTFLMMGGWILVLIVGVGIAFAISFLFQGC